MESVPPGTPAGPPDRSVTTSSIVPPPSGQQTFADFMYAVVIGVAFSDIRLNAPAWVLFVTFFLLVVVLEDFFLYQTQVKPLTNIFRFTSFSSLVFEVSILLSWYLSFLSRTESRKTSFLCLATFSLLKWFASLKHLTGTPLSQRWVIHRDHLFALTAVVAITLAFVQMPVDTRLWNVRIPGEWSLLATVWLAQTILWWRFFGRVSAPVSE